MLDNIIRYCGNTYNRKDFNGDDLAWELYIAERKAKDYAEFALEKLDKKKLAKKIEKINKRYQKTNLKSNISKKASSTKPVMIEVALTTPCGGCGIKKEKDDLYECDACEKPICIDCQTTEYNNDFGEAIVVCIDGCEEPATSTEERFPNENTIHCIHCHQEVNDQRIIALRESSKKWNCSIEQYIKRFIEEESNRQFYHKCLTCVCKN